MVVYQLLGKTLVESGIVVPYGQFDHSRSNEAICVGLVVLNCKIGHLVGVVEIVGSVEPE